MTKKYISEYNRLGYLKDFIPYGEFEQADYYGVSMIKAKRDNKYRIKLIYDYNRNALMSKNQLEFNDINEAMKVYEILDHYAVNKGEIVQSKFTMKEDEEKEVEDVW